jgi:ribosomal protein L31
MAKKNLHPQWYKTKVYCDGQLVLEVGGTKEKVTVETWSGNHPIFLQASKLEKNQANGIKKSKKIVE